MSACVINTAKMSARAPKWSVKPRLFAVDYASQGRTGWQ